VQDSKIQLGVVDAFGRAWNVSGLTKKCRFSPFSKVCRFRQLWIAVPVWVRPHQRHSVPDSAGISRLDRSFHDLLQLADAESSLFPGAGYHFEFVMS
jgi:hypothetical protein